MNARKSIQSISVIVPENPFVQKDLKEKKTCLCALDVSKMMEWWPGTPHSPHRDANKVKAIQRSLDWKRVAHIAAYLLQQEIHEAPERLNKYFKEIYQPKKYEPGREWPPKINKIIGFQRSVYPTFSNVLLHVNGAQIETIPNEQEAANLIFDEDDPALNFSVIDGQHRINGAYFAVCILKEKEPHIYWKIPAEVFLDLDPKGAPPRKQAQIFIDVNFYQKKVDRSLVADLFPTARDHKEPIDDMERAQDIGRSLMLEKGPLVGMIQVPGIKYGVKDVITLSTLNGAIEDVIKYMEHSGIDSLEMQTDFLAQCLSAWFEASGRFETMQNKGSRALNPQNVAYQGRILVSVITLIPAMIWKLKEAQTQFLSEEALNVLTGWLKQIAGKAGLLESGIFISKDKFKKRGYLGSGGIGRFRDELWASVRGKIKNKKNKEDINKAAGRNRKYIDSSLGLSNA